MEPTPLFPKPALDIHHFQELKKLVYERVKNAGVSKLRVVKLKSILLPFIYCTFYIAALNQKHNLPAFYFLYACMGGTIVLTFLNCIHEAAHNTLFRSKKWNTRFMYVFDLMGANSFVWKARHIRLHHNFANVKGWESDIQQNGLVRILPADDRKPMHHCQHIYMFFIYPFYLLNWLLIRDFKDYFSKKQVLHKITEIPRKEYFKLVLFKLLFIFYVTLVPVLYFGFSISTGILGLVVMLVFAGIIALFALLPPHASIKSDFPVTSVKNSLATSWFIHQMITTNDVSTSNWLTKYCMGNFNYHLAHHLFPNISHVYAEDITRVIQQYSLRYDLPYRSCSLITAFKNHYALIKMNALHDNLFEEDM